MANPVLSIIVPAFQSEKTLAATLDSIVNQRFRNLECWIIDGQSTDATLKIAKKYSAAHPFIRFISGPDQGIYDAMNKGIGLATGDYLYFMGSDDVFCNNSVLDSLYPSLSSGQFDFIYGDIVFRHSGIRYGEEKTYLKLIKNLENINHQSIFYAKTLFTRIGKYDLRFPIYADFNFNIKCFKDPTVSKHYTAIPICIFNEKGTSFFHRDKDRYIEAVHETYVKEQEDPVALYDTVKMLEAQLANLLNSKDYLAGKKIGDAVRRFRKLAGWSPKMKKSVAGLP